MRMRRTHMPRMHAARACVPCLECRTPHAVWLRACAPYATRGPRLLPARERRLLPFSTPPRPSLWCLAGGRWCKLGIKKSPASAKRSGESTRPRCPLPVRVTRGPRSTCAAHTSASCALSSSWSIRQPSPAATPRVRALSLLPSSRCGACDCAAPSPSGTVCAPSRLSRAPPPPSKRLLPPPPSPRPLSCFCRPPAPIPPLCLVSPPPASAVVLLAQCSHELASLGEAHAASAASARDQLASRRADAISRLVATFLGHERTLRLGFACRKWRVGAVALMCADATSAVERQREAVDALRAEADTHACDLERSLEAERAHSAALGSEMRDLAEHSRDVERQVGWAGLGMHAHRRAQARTGAHRRTQARTGAHRRAHRHTAPALAHTRVTTAHSDCRPRASSRVSGALSAARGADGALRCAAR